MKRMMVFLFLSLVPGFAWGGQEVDGVVLGKFDFESPSLAEWEGGAGMASVETGGAFSGKGCLHITLDKKSGGQIYRGVSLPAVTEPRARLLRITVCLKTLAIQKGEVTISLLKIFDKGKNPEWFDYMSSKFATLPVAPKWMTHRRVPRWGADRPDCL